MRIDSVLLALALCLICFRLDVVAEEERDPDGRMAQAQDLVRQGIEHHDGKEYAKAIEKYREALELAPGNPLILYELSNSFFYTGDLERSLEIAQQALKKKPFPKLKGMIYTTIGNCHDELGKPKKAIKAYQRGIKAVPTDGMLYFNQGLTYGRIGKTREAKVSLKQGLRFNPSHASSHVLLGSLFLQEGEKIPALMALVRFLILEPGSSRSNMSLKQVYGLLQSGVSVDGREATTGKEKITIRFNDVSGSEEGDFSAVNLGMSLMATELIRVKSGTDSKEQTLAEKRSSNMELIFSLMKRVREPEAKKKGFCAEYYAPYYRKIHENGFSETVAYLIMRSDDDPDVQKWFSSEANETRLMEFLQWSKDYEWSAK